MRKILCDFEIQTDNQIPGIKPDLVIDDKKGEPAKLWTFPPWQTTELRSKKKKRELKNYGT